MIRQGDVLLIPTSLPKKAEVKSVEGLKVSGERTGHAHELACNVFVHQSREYAVLSQGAILTHQEHRHLKIPAGVYEIRIQSEYIQKETVRRYD